MANKKQTNSKYENEIEKLRNENKWDKLRDYVKVLPKDSKYELLSKLCQSEADLERYLFFNPLFNDVESTNVYIVDKNLETVEQYLNDIIKTDNKYTNEANILLSKLYYSQSRISDTLIKLDKTVLIPQENRTLRNTQLIAEGCSLKAYCLELLNVKSNEEGNHENQIIEYFDRASNLAIEYSESIAKEHQQQKYSTIEQTDEGFDLMNPLYEIALQKVPVLFIKQGNISAGLDRFRSLLSKPHIQSMITIRQSLLKKFGESLLTSVCGNNYQMAKYEKKNEKVFKPNNLDEETLLCLSLSQYLASKEVMLLRQPQYKQTREKTFNNAMSSLDLLIVYLAYRKSFSLLTEKFESTTKYSFEQFYVWYQFGLSLICSQKFQKAYLVLKECHRMKPDHIVTISLLAKLALENLLLIDEAIEWSKKGLEINGNNLKGNIIYGCSLINKAYLEKQHGNKMKYLNEALDSFKKAHKINPHDYLPFYHLSHCYSLLRKINESIENIQKALALKSDDKDCLHLLCLLLTSTKNYEEAYTVILRACSLYEDFELIYTKSRIEEHLFGFKECMSSLITLIEVYKKKVRSLDNIHYTITNNRNSSSATLTANNNNNETSSSIETASFANLQNTFKLNEAIGKTITMLLQTDTSLTKQFLQETQQPTQNATFNSSQLASNGQKSVANLLQLIRILSEICEFYIRHNRIQDAELCCHEIGNLHSMSYTYTYLKGRIHEHKKDYLNAKTCFNNVLSINPAHMSSLEHISICLFHLNELNSAEKMIRDAITINSSLPHLWYILGFILDASNDSESALKCYQTSLQLESTHPIVQFSSLTKIL